MAATNSPYTTAGGTAAAAAVVLSYIGTLLNDGLVAIHVTPMPSEVIAALAGLAIGFVINYTHGAPAAPASATPQVSAP